MSHLWGNDGERARTNDEVAQAGKLVVAVEGGENVVVALEVVVGTTAGEINLPSESYITYNSDGSVDDYIERLDIEGVEEETVYGPLGDEMSYWLEQNFDVTPDPDLPIFHQVDEDGLPIALTVKDGAGQKYGIVLVDLPNNETPPPTPAPFAKAVLAREVEANEPETTTNNLVPRVDLPTYNPHDPEIANDILNGSRTGLVRLSNSAPPPGETYIQGWGDLKSIEEATRVIPDKFDPENSQFVSYGYDMVLSIQNPNGIEMFVSIFVSNRVDHVNGDNVVTAWEYDKFPLAVGGLHGSASDVQVDQLVQRIRNKNVAMGENNSARIGIDFKAPYTQAELENWYKVSNCADDLTCRMAVSSDSYGMTTPTLEYNFYQLTEPTQTLEMSIWSFAMIRLQ
jgi:hypothetical protein